MNCTRRMVFAGALAALAGCDRVNQALTRPLPVDVAVAQKYAKDITDGLTQLAETAIALNYVTADRKSEIAIGIADLQKVDDAFQSLNSGSTSAVDLASQFATAARTLLAQVPGIPVDVAFGINEGLTVLSFFISDLPMTVPPPSKALQSVARAYRAR